MRNWFARILLLGLASLPCSAYAQYPASGYYYTPQPAYGNYYPQYQPQHPQVRYYYVQPMPRYVPSNPPVYQAMPMYQPQAYTQQPAVVKDPRYQAMPVSQPRQVATQPVEIFEARPNTVVVPDPSEPATRPANNGLGSPLPTSPPSQLNGDSGVVLPPASARTPVGTSKEPAENIAAPGQSNAPLVSLRDILGPRKCRFMVFGDFLYWNVHGVDVPYAQPFDGIDPVFSVPRGPVAVVSPQFKHGIRTGTGVSLSDGNWVVGTFTYFRTERDSSTRAPDGFVLHNYLAFPNTANSAVDSLTASANYRMQLMIGDIDYKCAIVSNDSLTLNWIAGARYAHLDQDLLATFQVAGTSTVDSHISFDGFGPRIGLEGQYRLKCGFYGYANGTADLLVGQFRGSAEQRNVFVGLVGDTSVTANRLVPVLEMEIGAGWQTSCGRLRASAGYYVGSWHNTMTITSLHGGIGNKNFTTNGNNFRDSMVFDGVVLKFEFRF